MSDDSTPPKSPRFRFSAEQVGKLEAHFLSNGVPSDARELTRLAGDLSVTSAQVKNWFNTRKAKERNSLEPKKKKKSADEDEDEDEDEEDEYKDEGNGHEDEDEDDEEDEYKEESKASSSKRKAGGEEGSGSAKKKAKKQEPAGPPGEDLSWMIDPAPFISGVNWRHVVDVPKLQDEVVRLGEKLRETEMELRKAKAKVAALEKTGEKVAQVAVVNEEKEKAAAVRMRKAICSSLNAQMVYRPGLKSGNSRLSGEAPNVTPLMYKTLVGDAIFAEMGNKKIQHKVKLDEMQWTAIFGGSLHKSLRYGAHLAPNFPLTMTFNKESALLTVTGTFTMHK